MTTLLTSVREVARSFKFNLILSASRVLSLLPRHAEPPFSASALSGSPGLWRSVWIGAIRLECEAFGSRAFRPAVLGNVFSQPAHVVVLLRDSRSRLFGFALAEPVRERASSAYLTDVVVDERCRGKKLVGVLLSELETALATRSYEYLELDAMVSNGFAGALERHYGDRIVESRGHGSSYGPQRYLRIRIDRDVPTP